MLLHIATKTPKFDFVLDFMEDCDRDKIKYVIGNLGQLKQEKAELAESLREAFSGL